MPSPPRRKTEWKDEYTLLCERCGYIIEDLDQSLPCPECGKPISESLPEHRTGTPWQRHNTDRNLFRTWLVTIRYPFKTLNTIYVGNNVAEHQTTRTLTWTVVFTSLAVYLSWVIENPHWITIVFMFVMTAIVGAIFGGICASLTYIVVFFQSALMMLFGKYKRYRITRGTTWAILNHASVGLVFFGFFFGVSISLDVLATSAGINDGPTAPNQYAKSVMLDFWSSVMLYATIPGLLFFQVFTFLGIHRCKYANRPRLNQSENSDA